MPASSSSRRPGTSGSPCPLCVDDPPAPGAIRIQLQVGDVVQMGAWCGSCALPSVVYFEIWLTCRHGWRTGHGGTVPWCGDHHGYARSTAD